MKLRTLLLAALLATALVPAGDALAWGRDAHAVVGMLAADHFDERARATLQGLLGDLEADTLEAACNWPDDIRDTPAGEGTSPWHYVNIPRAATRYDRERDCPGGDCVTERILYFASRLGDERLEAPARREAFDWLCHLVGDLHQPLHVGYADDRGGNSVNVRFRGEEMDLHELWDAGLARAHGMTRDSLYAGLSNRDAGPRLAWAVDSVARWADESHELVRQFVYPESSDIDEAFAQRAWRLSQAQIVKAAGRLATIVNGVLGDGEVLFAPRVDERN